MQKIKFTLILSLIFSTACWAQELIIGATAHYMYQLPSGSIAIDYGANSNAGFGLNMKLFNNITLGAEGQFLFGSNVKDKSILGRMVTSGGYILGQDNTIEIPELEGRGGNFFVEVGKIFPLSTKSKNNGLHVKLGLGYLFYSIYADANVQSITQLSGEYANGYNRLESGLSLQSFVGYTFYSSNKFLNGSIGLQGIYASTKYQGILDYSTGLPTDASSRSSFFIGPKVAMTIALKRFQKRNANSDGYFYN